MITTEHINQAEIEARFKEATIRIIGNDPVGIHKSRSKDEQATNIMMFILNPKPAKEKVRKEYESYLAGWSPEELLYLVSMLCTDMAMTAIVSRLKEVLGEPDEDKS